MGFKKKKNKIKPCMRYYYTFKNDSINRKDMIFILFLLYFKIIIVIKQYQLSR